MVEIFFSSFCLFVFNKKNFKNQGLASLKKPFATSPPPLSTFLYFVISFFLYHPFSFEKARALTIKKLSMKYMSCL